MEEVKRCELKLPVEIKITARIRCGGRVPTGDITSRNPVKEEKVPTTRLKVGAHPRHEAEGLQGGVARA
jgi:hypothetical protein